ncbi:MAG: hypothetical protein NTW79_00930 [Candidatus Berkelbacteria bacterium]|nr:hypothetical protein [Candidatus Berkelbacteria bacterium]
MKVTPLEVIEGLGISARELLLDMNVFWIIAFVGILGFSLNKTKLGRGVIFLLICVLFMIYYELRLIWEVFTFWSTISHPFFGITSLAITLAFIGLGFWRALKELETYSTGF